MQTIKNKLKLSLIFIVAVIFSATFFNFQTALAENLSLTVYAGNRRYEFSGEELGYYNGRYYLKCLEGVVDKIYYDTLIAPVDAKVIFSPTKTEPFIFCHEKDGLGIYKQKLIDDINTALYGGKTKVLATFIPIKAKVMASELKKFTNLKSQFSTEYLYSSGERKHNIQLAVQKISGTVIKKGEVFSFNKIVGERTEENGFKNAVVIENGDYVDGVGGGVCQVSTTLYNCALLSGIKVIERHAHSLAPSYVEPSFDAMVSGSVSDLKFINDTGGDLYIKGVADGRRLTFVFYGEKSNTTYERVSVILAETLPIDDEIVLDDDLYIGEKLLFRRAKNGIKSEGYLVCCQGDKIISKVKLHTDVYKPLRGIVKVGNKELENTDNLLIDNLA